MPSFSVPSYLASVQTTHPLAKRFHTISVPRLGPGPQSFSMSSHFVLWQAVSKQYSVARLKSNILPSQHSGLATPPFHRPVTRGAKALLENYPPRPPLEKCVGHRLKLFNIVQKNWAPLRKLFTPPGVPSWLQAWFHTTYVKSLAVSIITHDILN